MSDKTHTPDPKTMQNQPGREADRTADQKHAAGNQGERDQRPPMRSGEATPGQRAGTSGERPNADGNRSNSDDPRKHHAGGKGDAGTNKEHASQNKSGGSCGCG